MLCPSAGVPGARTEDLVPHWRRDKSGVNLGYQVLQYLVLWQLGLAGTTHAILSTVSTWDTRYHTCSTKYCVNLGYQVSHMQYLVLCQLGIQCITHAVLSTVSAWASTASLAGTTHAVLSTVSAKLPFQKYGNIVAQCRNKLICYI